MKIAFHTVVMGILFATVESAFAWQTPPSLTTWDDLDTLVSDEYVSLTNDAIIIPPCLSFGLYAGFFTFEPSDEIAAITNLFSAGNILGVPVWKICVTETQTTERVWLLYGETSAEPFRTNSVPSGFNPDQWVEDIYGTPPAWLSGEKLDQWYRWRDRSRLHLSMTLIEANDWPLFLDAVRMAATNAPAPQNPPPTLPADTNRLAFAGIERYDSQTMRLWLYSPPDWAPIDLFASSVLPPPSNRWELVGTAPAGEPFSAWDEPLNGGRFFFHAARGDLDSDGDGIPDDREILLLMTDPGKADSDGDGLSDREELYRLETNPNAKDTDGDGVWDNEDYAPLTQGPLIEITSPSGCAALTDSPVTVSGVVTFAGDLAAVRVDGQASDISDLNNGTYAFTKMLSLEDGTHNIIVRAISSDAIPLESKTNVTVMVDALPSAVTILSPVDSAVFAGANVHVSVLTDSSNDVVTVNGSGTTRDGYVRYAWVTLSELGANTITVVAVDRLNRASTNAVSVMCSDLTDTDPADADSDGVPDAIDPDPGNPSVRSTVTITSPPNGAAFRY